MKTKQQMIKAMEQAQDDILRKLVLLRRNNLHKTSTAQKLLKQLGAYEIAIFALKGKA